VFAGDLEREVARWLIRVIGLELGIIPSSIQGLYEAIGQKRLSGFTVPAINIRGLTYDVGRAVIRTAKKNNTRAFIFEIAKSEIDYTDQRPIEYAVCCIAAAIKEGFHGPLFLQGDHFQLSAKKFAKDPSAETKNIKQLSREAVEAGFFNIDIDSSTLVDLSRPTVKEQQRTNFETCADITQYIRGLEPQGVTISVGGEIGEVGGKNSTVEEFKEFMNGYLETLGKTPTKGISKISVQTGTTHGGIPLPDGSIAEVELDFDVLESISRVARDEYAISGTVQHGASTLPEILFDKFPQSGTVEIHLATEFQNIIYEHPQFPKELKQRIYNYLKDKCRDEWKQGQTEEQFIYKTRKKAFGPFKREIWSLTQQARDDIGSTLEEKFDKLFRKLNVVNTAPIVSDHVSPVKVTPRAPEVCR
jgi:fructose/tagatose bisphosphate aldolase